MNEVCFFSMFSSFFPGCRNQDIDVEGDEYGHLRIATTPISSQETERHIHRSYSSSRDYVGEISYEGMRSGPGSSHGTLASPSSTRWSNTYGLSPQFLDSLGISGPFFDRIFVANVSSNQGREWLQGLDEAGMVICRRS